MLGRVERPTIVVLPSGWRDCCARTRWCSRFRVCRRVGGAPSRVLQRCLGSRLVRGRMVGVDVGGVHPDRRQAALISSMKGAGPHRYASASRGGFGRQPVPWTACGVEVAALDIVGTWTAVVRLGACVRERSEESAGLGGERVLAAVACGVQGPDLAIEMLLPLAREAGRGLG